MHNRHLTITMSCKKILVKQKFVVVEDFLISYHHCCFLAETLCDVCVCVVCVCACVCCVCVRVCVCVCVGMCVITTIA